MELAPVRYCQWHKDTPSNVRCGRCDASVCPKCMTHAPVGIRCPDCGKPRPLPTYQLSTSLALRALGASLLIGAAGGVGALLISQLPFGLFMYLIASAGFGYVVAEGTSLAANRKRGRSMGIIAALGGAAAQLPLLAAGLAIGAIPLGALLGAAIAAVVAFMRLR